MHGGKIKSSEKKTMMGGGRMMYGHGGYASVSEMEKKCNSMASYQESGQRKG